MTVREDSGSAFIDLLLSFVLLSLAFLAVDSHQKTLAIFNSAEKKYGEKRDQYMFDDELFENCSEKKIFGSFIEKKCCRDGEICAVFVVPAD